MFQQQTQSGLSGSSLALLGAALLIVYFTFQRYQKGLRKYPGPILASVTDNWRLQDVWKRDAHITYQKLHQKYGDVVRVGPNALSFGQPGAVADIYGLNKGYTKVRFP